MADERKALTKTQLIAQNTELWDQIDQLNNEIGDLKELLADAKLELAAARRYEKEHRCGVPDRDQSGDIHFYPSPPPGITA